MIYLPIERQAPLKMRLCLRGIALHIDEPAQLANRIGHGQLVAKGRAEGQAGFEVRAGHGLGGCGALQYACVLVR